MALNPIRRSSGFWKERTSFSLTEIVLPLIPFFPNDNRDTRWSLRSPATRVSLASTCLSLVRQRERERETVHPSSRLREREREREREGSRATNGTRRGDRLLVLQSKLQSQQPRKKLQGTPVANSKQDSSTGCSLSPRNWHVCSVQRDKEKARVTVDAIMQKGRETTQTDLLQRNTTTATIMHFVDRNSMILVVSRRTRKERSPPESSVH